MRLKKQLARDRRKQKVKIEEQWMKRKRGRALEVERAS